MKNDRLSIKNAQMAGNPGIIFCFIMLLSTSVMAQTQNSFAGSKTAFMHDDALSSDVFTGAAPEGNVQFSFSTKMGAVPTLLLGSDGLLQVICVRNENKGASIEQTPYLLLLQPETLQTLASLKLPAGRALNNIYGYLNEKDELMLANGNNIFRIRHTKNNTEWSFTIAQTFTLKTPDKDFQFVAITPDWKGNIWFVSYNSIAGFLNPGNGKFTSVKLSRKKDEIVANSISASPDGIAIATTYALYMLHQYKNKPAIIWKANYDRGNRVKPGQLSWGTGSSPTFFGEKTGFEYVTILDAGTNGTHLNIYNTKTGTMAAQQLAFGCDVAQGSENSPIGYKNSVIIASTYGFQYPASSSATTEVSALKKGMQRIDVLPGGTGAKSVWFNKEVRTTSVPKLGKEKQAVYFIDQDDNGDYFYTEVDYQTGKLLNKIKLTIDPYSVLPDAGKLSEAQKKEMLQRIGDPFNPIQMAGLFDGEGNLYQGTILGILKISSPNK